MKTFYCDACHNLVFFENVSCLSCGHVLGFLPDVLDLSAVEPEADERLRALAVATGDRRYRICANTRDHSVCNWLVPSEETSPFCASCRMNDVIPDLNIEGNRTLWHRLELAKRRLVYTLLKLDLPTDSSPKQKPLRFRFLGDAPDGTRPVTGHAEGVITINIAEADDAVREQQRVSLHEPFRSLLGHFRHEVAHYYWDCLIADGPHLERFRLLFGLETADYEAALQGYYHNGAPADWANHHVSAYASAHPWEDWAETTAHYLHLIDTVETAASFGMSLRPRHHPAADTMTSDPHQAAQPEAGFDALLAAWFPLTYALNSLNRGVGLPDVYPFVLSEPAIAKLRFVHDVLSAAGGAKKS